MRFWSPELGLGFCHFRFVLPSFLQLDLPFPFVTSKKERFQKMSLRSSSVIFAPSSVIRGCFSAVSFYLRWPRSLARFPSSCRFQSCPFLGAFPCFPLNLLRLFLKCFPLPQEAALLFSPPTPFSFVCTLCCPPVGIIVGIFYPAPTPA